MRSGECPLAFVMNKCISYPNDRLEVVLYNYPKGSNIASSTADTSAREGIMKLADFALPGTDSVKKLKYDERLFPDEDAQDCMKAFAIEMKLNHIVVFHRLLGGV
jgi:hypothetical protein